MPMHDQTELTALLADLVRIDSINPDLIPGANGEADWAPRPFCASFTAGDPMPSS